MKVLVIGGGGREHALCHTLKRSPSVSALFCAPGNAGIAQDAECIELKDHGAILTFCRERAVDLVVIGPEQPLVDGLADVLRAAGIATFGCSQIAAQLEASKGFTKDLCRKYGIPTAAYARFDREQPALDYLKDHPLPIVVKADGLAAGKGVIIAATRGEAEAAVRMMFGGTFGAAGARVVIEEFLEGEELSFFALADGEHAVEFGSAQDHKRAFDGDTGPNTGGMGTLAPAPQLTDALRQRIMEDIIHPTIAAMKEEGAPFAGVLFAGLMLTSSGPKLIEYNVRFGDPEAQVLMLRLADDLGELLLAAAKGKLPASPPRFHKEAAVCVVMAAKGYPGDYEKGSIIEGVEQAGKLPGVTILHAGTRRGRNCGRLKANGGRVLNVCALGKDLAEARLRAYQAVDAIDWPQGFCRRDIAARVIGYSSPEAV